MFWFNIEKRSPPLDGTGSYVVTDKAGSLLLVGSGLA